MADVPADRAAEVQRLRADIEYGTNWKPSMDRLCALATAPRPLPDEETASLLDDIVQHMPDAGLDGPTEGIKLPLLTTWADGDVQYGAVACSDLYAMLCMALRLLREGQGK